MKHAFVAFLIALILTIVQSFFWCGSELDRIAELVIIAVLLVGYLIAMKHRCKKTLGLISIIAAVNAVYLITLGKTWLPGFIIIFALIALIFSFHGKKKRVRPHIIIEDLPEESVKPKKKKR